MKVRILSATPVAGALLPPDCVVDLPASIVDGLVKGGTADPDEGAVAYAERLGVEVPEGLPDFKKELAADAKAAKAEG